MRHSRPTVHILCVLFAVLFLQGCPSKPPPAGVRFPIASGSHTNLPATDQPILVWADPPLIEIAVEWLQAHHYSNLSMPKTLRGLACQALATAWGFRPSGQLDIPSTLMCTAGQTDSIPVR